MGMRRSVWGLTAAFCAVSLAFPVQGHSQSITTDSIVSDTMSAVTSCMHWRPVGTCFWLRCSLFSGCSIRTSLKVGHFNPDLVVSAYGDAGNPWTEIRESLSLAADRGLNSVFRAATGATVPLGSGAPSAEATKGSDHRNLLFKEVDVVGHPWQLFAELSDSFDLLCSSVATPFLPYKQSKMNAVAWRMGVTEVGYPATWVPGMREIGRWPLNTWGPVHPRHGFVTQAEDPKAAAVIAQRAGDIVTRAGQPHVYQNLESGGTRNLLGSRVWLPPSLRENNWQTGQWQMHVPVSQRSCEVFGSNDLGSAGGWSAGKVSENGSYAWTLWRPYQCCARAGQVFLGNVDWMNYP